jgi:hypothetical protein
MGKVISGASFCHWIEMCWFGRLEEGYVAVEDQHRCRHSLRQQAFSYFSRGFSILSKSMHSSLLKGA